MLTLIKNKLLKSEEKKRLAANIFSLTVLQAANYVLPLLTVPYLVRVLGPEYFGLLAFATATLTYFMLITDYGFNLSATRQVSIYRENKDKINEIFIAVMVIKFSLVLVSLVLMTALIFSFEKFREYWQVYYLTFGVVIGQALFPIWLFQGMERMKYITHLTIGSKAFFTICVFIFVKKQDDFLLVPLLTSLGSLVVGMLSIYLVKKQFSVRFEAPSLKSIKFQLEDGWHVFYSSIAISLYTVSTTFILGLFSNNTVLGYYSAADKIIQAVKGLYQPVSQAVYPLVGRKIHEDRKAGLAIIKKLIQIIGSSMFIVSLVIFLLAEPIVSFLLGAQYEQSVLILRVMAFLPLIISLSNIFGIQAMLNLGYKKAFSWILTLAAFVGMISSLILIPIYDAVGAAVVLLIVEIFVTTIMFGYLTLVRRF